MTDKLIAGNGKVEFGSFVLEELFTASKGDTDLQKRDINGKGQFVVTSGETNQGIEGRTDRPAKIFPANTITIDFLGNVYYREYEYKMVTHNRVCSLSGNVIRNDKVGIYLVGVLSKLRTLFSYNHAATWDRLKILTIELPVTSTNDIDFAYMEERIAELEQERIAELDAYLAASGLDDYELTDEDKEILSLESAFDEAGASEADHGNRQIRFKKFLYSDLFSLLPQAFKVSKRDFVSDGKTPAYSSETANNGRLGFVNKNPLFPITKKTPVYLVFGDHTRAMNIVHESFCVMDNVKVLVPKIEMTDEILLYIAAAWKKAIPNFGYARHWSIAKVAEFELPVFKSKDPNHKYTVDDIDFDYMERYIRAIEKLTIADVAKYKDKLIDTTKQLVTE